MNFEFIDLSLDDRQFKGETHNKNLEDVMKQAIVNFCKSMDTGLFLLDMPTGFGKTYSVLDFMVDNYDAPEFKDKKIFFVTTLKKNLPDKELREHFANRSECRYGCAKIGRAISCKKNTADNYHEARI